MRMVEEKAWNFDPSSLGYEWDEETKQDYQRHFPEGYGIRSVTSSEKK